MDVVPVILHVLAAVDSLHDGAVLSTPNGVAGKRSESDSHRDETREFIDLTEVDISTEPVFLTSVEIGGQ